MPPPDILIGHKLSLYGEVLTSAFSSMRPELLVQSVPHDDLDEMVKQLQPFLVICSSASQVIRDWVPAWIALYPEETDQAVVSVTGHLRTIPHATLNQLLTIASEVLASRTWPVSAETATA